jgi:hypothetical protein
MTRRIHPRKWSSRRPKYVRTAAERANRLADFVFETDLLGRLFSMGEGDA